MEKENSQIINNQNPQVKLKNSQKTKPQQPNQTRPQQQTKTQQLNKSQQKKPLTTSSINQSKQPEKKMLMSKPPKSPKMSMSNQKYKQLREEKLSARGKK